MKRLAKIGVILGTGAAVGLFAGYYFGFGKGWEKSTEGVITTFEECFAAGYPVTESYPAACSTPDGRFFAQTVPIIAPGDSPIEGGVACTMDAKLCSDGSAVGRIPPSCEFAPCPEEATR